MASGEEPRQWVRDILLTFFIPPLGLVFTGPDLFVAKRRRAFTRQEQVALLLLVLTGVWLTLIWIGALTMTTSFTESGG